MEELSLADLRRELKLLKRRGPPYRVHDLTRAIGMAYGVETTEALRDDLQAWIVQVRKLREAIESTK
jgi:hypothetical protein